MSLSFTCGPGGCVVTEIDDDAWHKAARLCEEWVRSERIKWGEYPPIDEQGEYFTAAYTRLTAIQLTIEHECPHCGARQRVAKVDSEV